MTASFDAPDVGTVLADRYELVRLIARGGMSDVYEATDRVLGRQAAVKLYRATAVADSGRFEAEVQILATLNHPGLVYLYDAGEHGGNEFVVLELIDGPTLASVLAQQGPMAEPDLRVLAEAVADALAYVHAADVVHRDVTPSNILCGPDGRARLADFGIARLLDSSRLTAVAQTIGTAAYMAPEQVEGSDVTAAADVYGLGLVLLEALTGRSGFEGVGHEVLIARLSRDPDVSTGVPEPWRPVLAEMTARDPDERPSAVEVRDRFAALPPVRSSAAASSAAVAAASGAAASVVVGSAHGADGLAMTTQVPAAGGGTSVMPAAVRPEGVVATVSAPIGVAAHAVLDRWRRPAVIATAVLLLGLIVAVAAVWDLAGNGSTITSVPTADTIVTEVPTSAPTTAPPTTNPPKEEKGRGNGKGQGSDD